jgi:hypothetical protein
MLLFMKSAKCRNATEWVSTKPLTVKHYPRVNIIVLHVVRLDVSLGTGSQLFALAAMLKL